MATTAPLRGPVHDLLYEDHERLDALFAEVVQAADAGVDSDTLGEIWTRFDTQMRAHLEAEEELLLDPLEAKHPHHIRAIRATHDDIRARLDDFAVAVDLHLVRAAMIREFIDLIRDHATDEDEGLYRMAEAELGRRGLRARIRARLGLAARR